MLCSMAICIIMCLSMLLVSGQSNLDQPPRYSLQLDPAGHFKMEWSLDYFQEIVKFHLTAKVLKTVSNIKKSF